jgi:hypothetical protein
MKNRRAEKERERQLQVRQGKLRIQRYIDKQKKMERKLWRLGKQALQLGDQAQFRQIGRQILWTQQDINRWQRYLLNLETMEARRDQAHMAADFMQSLQAMSESLMAGADAASLTEIQQNIEEGMSRARDLEDRLSLFMEMAEFAVSDFDRTDSRKLENLESLMLSEAETDAAADFDEQIAEGLAKIREEMEKG